MKRGIISNNGRATRIKNDTVAFSGSLSQEDLNYYILYWDKIVIPTNNIIHNDVPGEKELISLGVIERPKYIFSQWSSHDNEYVNPFIVAQCTIAKQLISNVKDIDWSLHQIGEEIIIANGFEKNLRTMKVDLLSSLPVPLHDIHYEEILKFKEWKKDELIAFHSSIDELYLNILKSPDVELELRRSISNLENAIQNLEKSSLERFKKLIKYDFTAELNIDGSKILTALAGGAVFNHYSQLTTFPLATILSGLVSMIRIKASYTRSYQPAENKLKLDFLADASKQGIIE